MAATATTTATAAISLPAPRRKARVKEVPGAAVPIPSALPHPPCTHYEATYCQGHITVRDPRQAAALWHNGYYGHGFEGGGGGQRGRKKWKLVEAEGLKNAKWFNETREVEERRRKGDFKGGGVEEEEEWWKREFIGGGEEEGEGDEEEMEEEESEFEEENRRNEERMKWEGEEEDMREEEKEEEEEEEKKITNLKNENQTEEEEEEEKGMKEEETEQEEEEKKQEERETATKGNPNPTSTLPKPPKRPRNYDNKIKNENGKPHTTEPWRTVLTLSADQETTNTHPHDPDAYLTLLPEEALFLSYALGTLVLTHEEPLSPQKRGRKRVFTDVPNTHEMTIDEMWRAFVRDDPAFPVKYAAFHHFRSQGWVVKAGLKYGVDYVLYPVGPPFYHSQYAVRVHSLWADTLTLDHSLPGHQMTWTTVATTERLTNHINKTPVLCFVLRPRATTDQRLNLIECLKELKVQTVILGRWNPSDGSG